MKGKIFKIKFPEFAQENNVQVESLKSSICIDEDEQEDEENFILDKESIQMGTIILKNMQKELIN